MAIVDFLTQQSFLGIGRETTYGTAVVPGFWIPMSSPKWTPKLKWLPDTSMTGTPALPRDLVPSVRYDEITYKHNLYMDSIGNELLAVLGAADVVTGTGPFHHNFKLLNNPATGSQPPSYTIDYFDASQARQAVASRMNQLEFSWSADGAIEVTPSWICNPETDVTLPTNVPTTASFAPGWDIVITINGTTSLIMVSGSLTITRGTASIFTSSGQQGPHLNFAGPVEAKGKAKFLVETGLSSFFSGAVGGNNAMIRNPVPLVLTITEPVSGNTLAITQTTAQFQNPVLDPGQKYLQVDVEWTAVCNATDAVTTVPPDQATPATLRAPHTDPPVPVETGRNR